MRPLARATFLALASAACTDPGVDTAASENPAPRAWDYAAPDSTAPPSLADVTTHLQGVLDQVRGFHAGPILSGYQAAMLQQGPGCPAYYGMGEYQYWYDDCTTDSGARFNGYTFFQRPAGTPDYRTEGLTIWGSSTITLADGRELHVGGRLMGVWAEGQGHQVWSSRVKGTFAWDGEEADGTWLGAGHDLDLEMVAETLADGSGGRAMQLDGGIDGFGDPLDTVHFDGVTLTDPGAPLADGCVFEPAGVISARDAEGAWYELTFDNTADADPTDPATCDGCGTLVRLGETLGQVCLDFTPLVDWETPW